MVIKTPRELPLYKKDWTDEEIIRERAAAYIPNAEYFEVAASQDLTQKQKWLFIQFLMNYNKHPFIKQGDMTEDEYQKARLHGLTEADYRILEPYLIPAIHKCDSSIKDYCNHVREQSKRKLEKYDKDLIAFVSNYPNHTNRNRSVAYIHKMKPTKKDLAKMIDYVNTHSDSELPSLLEFCKNKPWL
jgi:hypothetical protein